MNRDRLTGLDSSFLHLERGPAHMHVASTSPCSRARPPATTSSASTSRRAFTSSPASARSCASCRSARAARSGSMTPASTSTTTSATPRSPSPGSEEQLRTLAARVFSQRLDRSKPVWEMWLVDGVEGDRFAIVAKTHHCLVDGVSGVDITTVLFDTERRARRHVPEPEPWLPSPEPSDAQVLAEALVERASSPAEIVRGARARVPRPAAGGRARPSTRSRPPARSPATGMAAPASPFNVADRPVPALRLGARRPRPASRRSRTSSAGRSTTSSSPPSPARSGATCARAGTRPRSSSCGRWSRSASAPTSEHGDAGQPRLLVHGAAAGLARGPGRAACSLVSETMGDLKESKQAVGATMMTQLADFAPPTIAGQAARLQPRQRFFNLVVTNVPGPQFPLYLLGRRMEALYPDGAAGAPTGRLLRDHELRRPDQLRPDRRLRGDGRPRRRSPTTSRTRSTSWPRPPAPAKGRSRAQPPSAPACVARRRRSGPASSRSSQQPQVLLAPGVVGRARCPVGVPRVDHPLDHAPAGARPSPIIIASSSPGIAGVALAHAARPAGPASPRRGCAAGAGGHRRPSAPGCRARRRAGRPSARSRGPAWQWWWPSRNAGRAGRTRPRTPRSWSATDVRVGVGLAARGEARPRPRFAAGAASTGPRRTITLTASIAPASAASRMPAS